MAQDIFDILASKKNQLKKQPAQSQGGDVFDVLATRNTQGQDRGIYSGFQRGFGSGVTGLATGATPQPAPEDEGWGEYLASITGGLVSDAPAFWAGGQAGALAGGALGSVVPGAGTAAGAGVGATIGAFTLPAFIKSSFGEYRDYAAKGGNLSFGDFLERAGRVAKETGKAGVVGAAMAGAGRFLPVMKRIPGLKKLMGTRLGRGAAGVGLEVGALTGTSSALEGELPTGKQAVGDIFTVLGMKGVGKGREAFGRYAKRPLRETRLAEGIKTPEVKSEFVKAAKDILPVDWEKRTASKEKQASYEDVLKDFLGSKNAKIVESAFEWRDKQARYEKKGGKFTPEQHKDMLHYSQKTGNPEFGFEDSFTDVSERLPKHAKEFVEKEIRPHLKKSLREWNENPITKNIHPREGLEEYYLPGMYENASKEQIKAVEHKVLTKFRVKNPFSNQKAFMTYNEAALEAGLKPRYKNLSELMKQYDAVNIKLMHNAELLDMVRKFQTHNNENIIVTSNKPRQYAKAAKEGYVSFEDPFLRSFKNKDGKWETSSKPALVQPEFASTFKGVFSKEAFRPDSKFWKVADQIKDQVNFMRVAASPFHYIAETESILGQRGLKGLRLIKMAREGRTLRQNKEFMMDAAKHGLKVSKRASFEGLQKGNSLIEKGFDLIDKGKTNKAVKFFKKASTYLFDEFIPNAKVVSYNEAIPNEITKFKRENKRAPTAKETTAIKRVLAEHMNNIFGGQNWEQSKVFRDPQTRKKLRRVFAFPDWTISAIKQAGSALKPGLAGRMSRRYLARYIMYNGAMAAFMRALYGGLVQTDKKNESVKGIKWDRNKAFQALSDVKSLKEYFGWRIPDVRIRYGKGKDQVLNPGRDDRGTRLTSHVGKQLLEIGGWLKKPIPTFFNKANPVFTAAYKQAFGTTPTEWGPFFVDRGWTPSGQKPWAGGETLVEQLPSRIKTLLAEAVPFGLRPLVQDGIRQGIKKWLVTFGGATPVGKDYSLFKANKDIKNALMTRNSKERSEKLSAIIILLRANNVPAKKIRTAIKKWNNYLKKQKKIQK